MWYNYLIMCIGMLLSFYLGSRLTKGEPVIPVKKEFPGVIDLEEEEKVNLKGDGSKVGVYNGEEAD